MAALVPRDIGLRMGAYFSSVAALEKKCLNFNASKSPSHRSCNSRNSRLPKTINCVN
jgi:hypothetical protein